jgi:hypothetical protein
MLKKISAVIFVVLALVAFSRPVFAVIGDVNGDGKVDMVDLYLVSKSFGAFPGFPRWNPSADVNNDGRIDMLDMLIVASHFGQ